MVQNVAQRENIIHCKVCFGFKKTFDISHHPVEKLRLNMKIEDRNFIIKFHPLI